MPITSHEPESPSSAPPPARSVKYPRVRTVVLDFDSTICAVESMDILFDVLLHDQSAGERAFIMDEVKRITDRGMTGEISFDESLDLRLELLPRLPVPFDLIVGRIREHIAPSFLRWLGRADLSRVHVISSGFRQLIAPCLTPLGIAPDHIHTNVLELDRKGAILYVNNESPLAHEGGKPKILESLNLEREIVMIGDGYTDFETADFGAANWFFGYAEFARRERVLAQADEVLQSFDELDALIDIRRSG